MEAPPNSPYIHTLVIVNQNVSKACHQAPGNLWMLGTKPPGDSLGCLTDHLKVPDNRILHHGIAQISFSILTNVLLDSIGTFQDMSQVDARISCHSGLASLRMRRRSSQ